MNTCQRLLAAAALGTCIVIVIKASGYPRICGLFAAILLFALALTDIFGDDKCST